LIPHDTAVAARLSAEVHIPIPRFAEYQSNLNEGELVMAAEPRVLVCTVATERNDDLARFEESCRSQGMEPEVFGMGRRWRGFGWRQRVLYRNLVRRRRDYDYVLFMDGYDSIVTAPLSEILQKFREMRTPLLFSAEVVSHPIPPESYPDETADHRYRYLNAGGFLGELRYALQVMTKVRFFLRRFDCSDQALYAQAHLDQRVEIALDHQCQIFQCLFSCKEDVTVKGGRYVNSVTGSTPCVVHANSGVGFDNLGVSA
jgi:hypothetical protein